ncbi:pilus assembly protein PilM [Pseudomonas sp. MWU12-2115]|nr:pilus assembly protein PilM [Pseudomonas sp. MWU12-2115]
MGLAMPAIGYLLTLMFVSAVLFISAQTDQNLMLAQSEVEAAAGNMMVYRNAVASFASSNPTMVGSVPDASLGLPTWYIKSPSLGNYVLAGRSFVYFAGRMPGLVDALVQRTESMNVGTNAGGVLYSPKAGNTGITLPAQIPVSSVVINQ